MIKGESDKNSCLQYEMENVMEWTLHIFPKNHSHLTQPQLIEDRFTSGKNLF